MPINIHFISGLPRSGSTMLAAILRQNPGFRASMSGPVGAMFAFMQQALGGNSEFSALIDDGQRQRVMRSVVEAYYADIAEGHIIFDTHRGWCGQLAALDLLFPDCRVICCVRSPAWILDSIERMVQKNPLQLSRMFNGEPALNVYTRAERLMDRKSGFIGSAWSALRQAWFSEQAKRLVVIPYEELAVHPVSIMKQLYAVLGEEPYDHDFEHLEYDEPQFDRWLGMPGLHKVAPRVEFKQRSTIVPNDLFNQFDEPFWEDDPSPGSCAVTILRGRQRAAGSDALTANLDTECDALLSR